MPTNLKTILPLFVLLLFFAPLSLAQDEHSHDAHSHESHSHDGHSHDAHSHESHSHDGHSHDAHSHESHSHDGHSHDGCVHASSDESSFYYRTPEEYRKAIIDAFNEAAIDAFICQMMVQEWREQGEDFSDDTFLEKLDSAEGKAERQKRMNYWLAERENVKKNSMTINYKKFGTVVGSILFLLILALLFGAMKNKAEKNQADQA